MAKVSGDLVNLINGVSQQAPALRLPTQLESQTNRYSTIVAGLKDRPPLELLAKILDSVPENAAFHIIDRDETERYIAVFTSETVRVFDFQGNEKTVTEVDNAFDYLASAVLPSADIRALTVADHTFVTNRQVVCAMNEGDVEPLRNPEAVINIKAGNYLKTYQIKINGNVVAEYTTPDGSNPAHAANIATTAIAGELYNDLVAAGFNTGQWGTGIHQNAIHIVNTAGNDFAIEVVDGVNGNATSVAKGSIQKFADLPNYGPHGFVVEIGNSTGTSLDNYFVKADKGGTNQNSVVVWRECVKPGTPLTINASTMPHLLRRLPDGTFEFRKAEWDRRKCGDGESVSPDPSFIGQKIEDVLFYRNRLGVLSDEGVVLSRSGSFFDFFRTTATAVLDDDPIDIMSTHNKVSFLRHSLAHQDYLLLFSTGTQFRLVGNDLLTPKTVSIRPLTEFNCSADVKPIAIGPSSFFVSDANTPGEYASVFEHFIDKSLETADADQINAHCPSYIPSGSFQIAGSPDQNVMALLTRGDPSAIFVYSYYWAKEEKLQSSWSRWQFDGCTILGCGFIDSALYVVYAKDGKVYLGKLRMDPAAFDEGFGFLVRLDHRIRDTDLAAGIYDAVSDTTTYTLPFNLTDRLRAVVDRGGEGTLGTELDIEGAVGPAVTLKGDTTGHRIWFGEVAESRFRFSTFHVRAQSAGGSNVAKLDGRLQLHYLTLMFDATAYFKVEVQRDLAPLETHVFNGIRIGDPSAVIGNIVLSSGRWSIPIMSRNDRVTIDVVNDSWLPSNFVSASWRGRWSSNSREV